MPTAIWHITYKDPLATVSVNVKSNEFYQSRGHSEMSETDLRKPKKNLAKDKEVGKDRKRPTG